MCTITHLLKASVAGGSWAYVGRFTFCANLLLNSPIWDSKYCSNATKWSAIKPEHIYVMHKLIKLYCVCSAITTYMGQTNYTCIYRHQNSASMSD